MNKFLLLSEIEPMLKFLIVLTILGIITFFASHLTIITQLPKIRRYLETMCLDTEEKEKEFKEKQLKEDIFFLIRFAVYGAIIGIAIICLFL